MASNLDSANSEHAIAAPELITHHSRRTLLDNVVDYQERLTAET
jgi:hypothetical protein